MIPTMNDISSDLLEEFRLLAESSIPQLVTLGWPIVGFLAPVNSYQYYQVKPRRT